MTANERWRATPITPPSNDVDWADTHVPDWLLMFGGWAQMWREFGDLKQSSARWRFIRAYKGVIGDTK